MNYLKNKAYIKYSILMLMVQLISFPLLTQVNRNIVQEFFTYLCILVVVFLVARFIYYPSAKVYKDNPLDPDISFLYGKDYYGFYLILYFFIAMFTAITIARLNTISNIYLSTVVSIVYLSLSFLLSYYLLKIDDIESKGIKIFSIIIFVFTLGFSFY